MMKSIEVKFEYDGEIHRNLIPLISLKGIKARVIQLFPVLGNKSFNLFYKDEDDDEIIIKSDEEIECFYRLVKEDKVTKKIVIKLNQIEEAKYPVMANVTVINEAALLNNEDFFREVHEGIKCNECETMPIVGIRWKCLVREQYNLCNLCQNSLFTSSPSKIPHPLIRITDPSHNIFFFNGFKEGFNGSDSGDEEPYQETIPIEPTTQSINRMDLDDKASTSINQESTEVTESHSTRWNLSLIEDVTIPAGTKILAGSTFRKTWTVQNTGVVDINPAENDSASRYQSMLVLLQVDNISSTTTSLSNGVDCIDGDFIQHQAPKLELQQILLPYLPVNEITQISVLQQAPEVSGEYIMHYRCKYSPVDSPSTSTDSGFYFGDTLKIHIIVEDNTLEDWNLIENESALLSQEDIQQESLQHSIVSESAINRNHLLYQLQDDQSSESQEVDHLHTSCQTIQTMAIDSESILGDSTFQQILDEFRGRQEEHSQIISGESQYSTSVLDDNQEIPNTAAASAVTTSNALNSEDISDDHTEFHSVISDDEIPTHPTNDEYYDAESHTAEGNNPNHGSYLFLEEIPATSNLINQVNHDYNGGATAPIVDEGINGSDLTIHDIEDGDHFHPNASHHDVITNDQQDHQTNLLLQDNPHMIQQEIWNLVIVHLIQMGFDVDQESIIPLLEQHLSVTTIETYDITPQNITDSQSFEQILQGLL